ncbi:MAG: hypothetical protein KY455_13470 [Euryarchaeota archaeon]|nr:hypothetical protein [Euryarchaeota archaeon]
MEKSRALVGVLLLVPLVLVAMPLAASTSPQPCHQNLSSVPVGTGTHAIDLNALNGVNHADVLIPSCSEGRFTLSGETSPNIRAQSFCADGFVRVYAVAGTFDNRYVINWLPDDGVGCGANALDETPSLP